MLSSSHGHNTPRQRPLSRSKSIVGSLKSLFTGFFRIGDDNQDDFEQSQGKRRALDQSGPDVSMDRIDEGGSRTKRMRIGSPENGYLDPLAFVFEQHPSSQFDFSITPTSRSPKVSIPSTTIRSANNNKTTATPVTRTMSMDPPTSRYSRHLTRDISMSIHDEPPMAPNQSHRMSVPVPRMSVSVPRDLSMRDLSLPPLRSSPLRMSLTPQNFGPSPLRRERLPSEPPAMTSLMSNPMFLKPPSESQYIAPDHQSTVTLGSLVDSQRSSRSPVRSHSALFGSQTAMSDASPTPTRINPAEKLLNDLEAYRTPFVPSRLRDSSTTNIVPGMSVYERERSGTPVLMQDRSSGSSRRRSGKIKNKKEAKREREAERERENEGKPYAGEGGMKKLLSRRKMEVAEEEERMVMGDGQRKAKRETRDVSVHTDSQPELSPPTVTEKASPSPVLAPSRVTTPNGGVEQSSLRVGRARTQRSHTPSARLPHKNKFSAAYEDGDGEGDGEEERRERERKELEEAAKKVLEFKIPSGFSFANDAPTLTPPDQHKQVANSTNDPIASLPVSFGGPNRSTSPIGSDTAPDASANGPPRLPSLTTALPVPSKLSREEESRPAVVFGPHSQPLPTKPSAPPHSVAASTPPKLPDFSTPLATSSVPNFFGSSVLLSKPPATTPMTMGESNESSSRPIAPMADVENPLRDGGHDGESKQPVEVVAGDPQLPVSGLFGGTFGGLPTRPVSGVVGRPPKPNGESSPNDTLTARGQPVSGFSLGAPPVSNDSVAPQQPLFEKTRTTAPSLAVESTPAPAPISSRNIFGGPLQTPEPSTKPTFSFGEKLPDDAPASDAAKPSPFFGNVPAFSFGVPSQITQAPVPTPAPEPPIPAFPFGQPSAPSTPLPLEPKPLFAESSGFTFGQPSPNTSTSTLPAQDKSTLKTPFSFGAAPSTPPAVPDKKPAFSFGAPPALASSSTGSGFSFGSNTPAPETFAFGSGATTSRPVTPPKNNEQEMRMEESPTRETQVKPPTTNGFSFGGSTLFGQGAQSQGQEQSPAPFTFGASNNNAFSIKTETKAAEIKPSSGGFGSFGNQTSSSSSGFSFGQQKVPEPSQPRPSTTGSFSFGAASQTPTAPQPTFAFGIPTTTAGNAFDNQPSSAPSSPSTFSQPGGFSFASTTTPASSGFSFGSSQPASPVNGNTSQIQPQAPSNGGGFTFGQTASGDGGQTSPFTAAPSSIGALFTIGSAPPAPPSQRQIKKLPNRRGGVKR